MRGPAARHRCRRTPETHRGPRPPPHSVHGRDRHWVDGSTGTGGRRPRNAGRAPRWRRSIRRPPAQRVSPAATAGLSRPGTPAGTARRCRWALRHRRVARTPCEAFPNASARPFGTAEEPLSSAIPASRGHSDQLSAAAHSPGTPPEADTAFVANSIRRSTVRSGLQNIRSQLFPLPPASDRLRTVVKGGGPRKSISIRPPPYPIQRRISSYAGLRVIERFAFFEHGAITA